MRTILKFLLALAAVLALGASLADARLAPGTIQKGQYTGNNTCNTSQNCYSPSGGSCVNGSCQTYTDPPQYCSSTNASGACIGYTDPPPYCVDWYTVPSMSGQICHTNYLLNAETLTYGAVGSGNQKLGADLGQSCSRSSNGTQHTPATTAGSVSCEQGSQSYYGGGSSGVCNTFTSTDNKITAYTQNGQVTRASSTDSDSSCTVEGRYATPDNSGPNISVNSVASVFSTDTENWCNIKKYRSEGFSTYGGTQNPALPGCTYYKGRTGHANGSDPAPDILEGLSITVSDSSSGVSDIRVELGSCDATYSFPTGIDQIIQSPTGQGTSSPYSDQTNIIIPYTTTFTVRGTSHPGLLAKFGKTRLDQCFLEGKNFLRITARDNARSDNDATGYDPNTSTLDVSGTNGYVNIDNSMPKFRLSGDARDVAAASDGSQCFDGGLTIADRFKNYSVGGNLEGTDPWGADASPSCSTCTVMTETGFNCNTVKTKPAGMSSIWVSPANVNPTTGIYTMSYCDGGSPLPDPQTCEWGCSTGYVGDSATQSCVCVKNPSNPSACATDSYTPTQTPVCTTGYTFDPGTGKCIFGGGASLFMLFDEATIASNSTANLQKAKLVNTAGSDPMRLVNPPETCSANVPKNMKFSTAGAYYGTVPSWPVPLNSKVFPVTLVCP